MKYYEEDKPEPWYLPKDEQPRIKNINQLPEETQREIAEMYRTRSGSKVKQKFNVTRNVVVKAALKYGVKKRPK